MSDVLLDAATLLAEGWRRDIGHGLIALPVTTLSPIFEAMRIRLFFLRWLWLAAVPAIAAMGPSAPRPGPVQLPRVESPAPETPEPPESPADNLSTTELDILDATEVAQEDFLGKARPLVIFADNASDASLLSQITLLKAETDDLIERDVVVITDTDPSANSAWRQRLRPSGFSLVLIDKDGQVKQRKPMIWDTREITRAIDKFPSRRVETGRGAFAQ